MASTLFTVEGLCNLAEVFSLNSSIRVQHTHALNNA